jgi:glycosyltransferase involved in cell wall biosynthesis
MKVFTYFVEPASYTIDLIVNVHSKQGIEHAFINSKSEAITNEFLSSPIFLSNLSLIQKIKFIRSTRIKNDFVIINGYNNYVFILTFLFNIFSINKKNIAVESDTQLKIPNNIIKQIIKYIYLNVIFRNKYVLGFAGGTKTHKDLFRNYGMKEERIFMIPMMVNNKKYYHENKIFPGKFTFLFVGRLLDTKNVDVLCERFLSAFSDKDSELIIVGGGSNLEIYKRRYKHKKIVFKGSIFGDDLLELYHNSSVFVFPSSVEAWGLVVNEAMSSSLSIIAHKEVGSVHDLIINKETGFVIDNWDELEEKMLELYNNPDLNRKMSENAVALMKDYWNYDLYTKNLLFSIQKVEQWI